MEDPTNESTNVIESFDEENGMWVICRACKTVHKNDEKKGSPVKSRRPFDTFRWKEHCLTLYHKDAVKMESGEPATQTGIHQYFSVVRKRPPGETTGPTSSKPKKRQVVLCEGLFKGAVKATSRKNDVTPAVLSCWELYGLLDDKSPVKLGLFCSSLQMFHVDCSKKKDVKYVDAELRRCSACAEYRKSPAYRDLKERLVKRHKTMTDIEQICTRDYLSDAEIDTLRRHISST